MHTITTPTGNIIAVFGEHDERTLEQLVRCVDVEEGARGVECADGHVGYSQPIGGVVAYRNYISPSGVGFDIACGNKAVKTDILTEDLMPHIGGIMDTISRVISFGIGRNNEEDVDSPFFDYFQEEATDFQRGLEGLAYKQLGTVGSGNHYVDLFAGDDGHIWIGVHFGSRGFGHKTATHYMELAAEGAGVKGHNDMDAPPLLLDLGTELGQDYLQAMEVAGNYAYAGRNWVCDRVLSVIGGRALDEVHNHHNFAWHEQHFGEDYWVVRKGATPAFPGQRGFVGGSMGDISVILRGQEPNDFLDSSADIGLYSTVHGAGRVMSRTQAAGKFKRRKKYVNNVREDDTLYDSIEAADEGALKFRPDGGAYSKRIWIKEKVRDGVINWDEVRADLKAKGIEVRGGGADEAPGVYKRLPDVLNAHKGTIVVEHALRPIGVVMAGADVYDPFKD